MKSTSIIWYLDPKFDRFVQSVLAFHHAASGSNPKHTLHAFSDCIFEILMRKGRK